jgi:purine-binding chemotaxis protein CheW
MSQPPSFDMPVPSAGNDGGDGGVVDWAEVRSRLERLSVGAAGGLTAADKSRVLKERAELLAQVITPDDDAAATIQVLEFLLGSERYAVDTSSVREVNVLKEITPVPRTPDFILGVISVRGRICSVVDLGRVFGLPPSEPGPEARAIVMASRSMEFAVRADEVVGMRHISTAALQTSLPTLTGARQKYLRGVTAERVAVLDAQRLLTDDALVVRDERRVGR